VVVTHHRELRARSPSGLMLESIDSPQGDQVARSAATKAIGSPKVTAITVTDMSMLVRVEVVHLVDVLDTVGGGVR
jgi:hypothetical protein